MLVAIWVFKFKRFFRHPMVISPAPFSTLAALLASGGLGGIGISGWLRPAVESVTASVASEPGCECHCQCERSTTTSPPPGVSVGLSLFAGERGCGFIWGLLAGVVLCCFAGCLLQLFARRAVRAVKPVATQETSGPSVAVQISHYGSARSGPPSPGRRRRGGGVLENSSARASEFGVVR